MHPGRATRIAIRISARRGRTHLPGSGVALPARRSARPLGGDRSVGVPVDRRRAGQGSRFEGRCSTRCTSAPSRPRARGRLPHAELAWLRELGVTCIEMMPVAEFPGRFGWGYDGVDLFAPDARSTARPDDFRALRRSRARARARRDPRRRLQPPRPGRQLPQRSSRPTYFTDRYDERVGRGDQLRRPERRRRCASSSSPTPATGSTSSTSTACASTRRRASSTPRPSTSSPRSASARAPRRGGPRRSSSSPRTSRSDARLVRPPDAGRLRPRRAVERRLPPQRAWSPLTGRSEAYYSRLPGHAAGAHLGGQVRLPVPGPALPLAEAAPRHAGARPAGRRRFVIFLQNHDQVANSGRGAAAARS